MGTNMPKVGLLWLMKTDFWAIFLVLGLPAIRARLTWYSCHQLWPLSLPRVRLGGTCILSRLMGIPPALWIWWFHRFFCSILAKKIEWLKHRILMNPSHLNPKPWLSTGSHLGAVFNVGGRGLTFPRLEELEGFEHVGLKPPIGSSAAHCRFLRGPRSSGEPGLIWRCHEGRYCSQRGRQVFHVFFWTS